MDTILSQHIVHAGWLIKSPPEKRIWKTKWRRRWFVLKLSGQIPGQYVLEYYTDSTCKKLKGTIDLDQCEQVDAGLQLEIRKQNYDNMFDLRTSKRTYYLVAGSEEEMNKWVECICAVCGLKMEAIQNELSLLPSLELGHDERYSPQPNQTEQQQQQPQQSQQSSTSESSLSTLNYIPISECYTGRAPNSPPPPRPPKPRTLTRYAKSQSSLALWPDQQHPPPHISGTKVQPAVPLPLPPPPKPLPAVSVNGQNRSLYLNSSNHHQQPQTYNFYDTWHSSSKRPDFLAPPQVNRDLKPRRRILEVQNNNANFVTRSDSNIKPPSQNFKRGNNLSNPLMNNRHTLPRPLITSYTLRNNQNKVNGSNNNGNYCLLAHCEQPKNVEDCERQYLDLDLDSDSMNSNNHSPRMANDANNNNGPSITVENGSTLMPPVHHQHHSSWSASSGQPDLLPNNNVDININLGSGGTGQPVIDSISNSGTVYKKVDFLKTKAFNEMRLNVNMYRNAN